MTESICASVLLAKVFSYASIMTKSTAAALAGVLALTIMLTGCTSADGPVAASTPTKNPPSTPSATPASTPAAPDVAEVVISTQRLTLLNADGTVSRDLTYFDAPDEAVRELTTAFGFEPVVEHVVPYEGHPGTRYTWEGFVLYDRDMAPEPGIYVDFSIRATAPAVRGVAIRAFDGTQVGSDSEAVAALYPDTTQRSDPWVNISADRIPVLRETDDSVDQSCLTPGCMLSTTFSTDRSPGEITLIAAPSENWGA